MAAAQPLDCNARLDRFEETLRKYPYYEKALNHSEFTRRYFCRNGEGSANCTVSEEYPTTVLDQRNRGAIVG